jgi:hypothetical protein
VKRSTIRRDTVLLQEHLYLTKVLLRCLNYLVNSIMVEVGIVASPFGCYYCFLFSRDVAESVLEVSWIVLSSRWQQGVRHLYRNNKEP